MIVSLWERVWVPEVGGDRRDQEVLVLFISKPQITFSFMCVFLCVSVVCVFGCCAHLGGARVCG